MPGLSPNGQKSKQKKKAGRKRKRRAQKAPARKRSALKKVAVAEEKGAIAVGRMERTRRLLLAALRVWELKHRISD